MNRELMRTVGNRVLEMIEDNIQAGVDIDGKKFAYSTKTFYRPYNEKLHKKLTKSQQGKLYSIITGKSGKLGMLIHGYKQYKEHFAPGAGFLEWTGALLRDMSIIKLDSNKVIIGFTDPELAQRAFWLNKSGVGRSRKLWKFFGLRREQVLVLEKEFQQHIIAELRKQFS